MGSWWVFSELAAVVKVMSGLFFRHSEVHVFFRGLKALPSIFYVKLVNTNTNASVRCWFDFNGALCMQGKSFGTSGLVSFFLLLIYFRASKNTSGNIA